MKKIYNLARDITSLAEFIEYEISSHNPGTSRPMVTIEVIENRCIALAELVLGLTKELSNRQEGNEK